jgi:spore germination protein GerM
VAVRKTKRKTDSRENSHGSQAVVIFWLLFIIVIIIVFMVNADTIKNNFNLFKARMTAASGTEEELLAAEEEDETVVDVQTPAATGRVSPEPDAVTGTAARTQSAEPQTERPAAPPVTERPQTPPAQTRDRAVYFTQVNNDGQILHSRVTRRIPVSDSPMQDALNVLLAGPSADEINRGLLNLIPQHTRILSATVRGNTAYISFSEDFLFNTFGVEGYVAQLRQIVWTVTEFQNINDVQILVEGRRLDYLGEGIWIGSPISRQSF